MLEREKALIEQRRTKKKFSSSFKMAAVEKVINNPDIPFKDLAVEVGVSYSALYCWYNKYKNDKLSVTSEKPVDILSEQELFFVRETIGAKERDKVRYCRKHGIPYEKLNEWTEMYKDDRYNKVMDEVETVDKNNSMAIEKLKLEISELKKQLRSMEKEKNSAVALLNLKKKVDTLLEGTNQDMEK